jgi:hypothetical protein
MIEHPKPRTLFGSCLSQRGNNHARSPCYLQTLPAGEGSDSIRPTMAPKSRPGNRIGN